MIFKLSTSLFLGLLLFALAANGQTAVPHSPGRLTDIKFRTLAWSDPVEDILYDLRGQAVPVAAYSHARSGFYQAQVAQSLIFYRAVTGTDGVVTKEIVADVPIPPDESMLLLLFFKGPDGRVKVTASPDDTQKFPAGSYRFVNTCSAPMAVAMGDKQAALPPLGSIVVKGTPEGPAGGVYVRVAVLGETNALIYSNKWLWSAESRTLVFIAPTGNSGQPFELKRITENAKFKDAQAKAGAPSP